MSLTVRILSPVRISVRPSIFFICEKTQNLGETGPPVPVFISRPAIGYCHKRSGPSRLVGTYPSNSNFGDGGVCVGGCVFARVHSHACVCIRSCMRDVFAIYDNNF